jgi:hypothetical protein
MFFKKIFKNLQLNYDLIYFHLQIIYYLKYHLIIGVLIITPQLIIFLNPPTVMIAYFIIIKSLFNLFTNCLT